MKCLDTERLIGYAYRLLDEPAAAEVCGHLQECTRCREAVAQYGRLDAVLNEWHEPGPSPAFDVRVRQAVEAEQARRERWGFTGWQWARNLALASLGVLMVAGLVWLNRNHRGVDHSTLVATQQSPHAGGAQNSGAAMNVHSAPSPTRVDVTPGLHAPSQESVNNGSTDDKDTQAMEDYDLAANFDVLSEIPKGERRVAN